MGRVGKVLGTTAVPIMGLVTSQGGTVVLQLTPYKYTNSLDLRIGVMATHLPTTIFRLLAAEVEVVTHIIDSMIVERTTTITRLKLAITIGNKLRFPLVPITLEIL